MSGPALNQTWAERLFQTPEPMVERDEGMVRKATSSQHVAFAKGGLLEVQGAIESEKQLASLQALAVNVGYGQVEKCAVGSFVIAPQGGALPQGVSDDLRSVAAPPTSVMPLVLMMVVAVGVLGLTTKIIANTHDGGSHFGEFNREVGLEFAHVLFKDGGATKVLVVLTGSPLHRKALEFQAFWENEERLQELRELQGCKGRAPKRLSRKRNRPAWPFCSCSVTSSTTLGKTFYCFSDRFIGCTR
jgi:hypothetical protein